MESDLLRESTAVLEWRGKARAAEEELAALRASRPSASSGAAGAAGAKGPGGKGVARSNREMASLRPGDAEDEEGGMLGDEDGGKKKKAGLWCTIM